MRGLPSVLGCNTLFAILFSLQYVSGAHRLCVCVTQLKLSFLFLICNSQAEIFNLVFSPIFISWTFWMFSRKVEAAKITPTFSTGNFPRGSSDIRVTGMLVEKIKLNPQGRLIWVLYLLKKTSRQFCKFLYGQPWAIPEWSNRVTFPPKHPKWDQNLLFTPLSETTSNFALLYGNWCLIENKKLKS